MDACKEGLFIADTRTEIETACEQIPKTRGVDGGIICTGFIDVEKILKRVRNRCGQPEVSHFFLEKKLPFQVVFIAFADEDESGSDCSGSGSSGSDSDSCSDDLSHGEHSCGSTTHSESPCDFAEGNSSSSGNLPDRSGGSTGELWQSGDQSGEGS